MPRPRFELTHVQDGIDVNNVSATVTTNGSGQTVVNIDIHDLRQRRDGSRPG